MSAFATNLATASMATAAGKDTSKQSVKDKNVMQDNVTKDIPKNASIIETTKGASLVTIACMIMPIAWIQSLRS